MASSGPSNEEYFSLSPQDVKVLQESNVFLPGPSSDGKRKISAAFLKPPLSPQRSISGSSSSGSASASIRIRDSGSNVYRETNVIDFPTSMSSQGAMEFVGLTPAAAAKVFQHWSEVSRDPDEILDFVKYHVRRFFNLVVSDDREAMTRAGLIDDFQSRILNAEFNDVRGTEPTWYWVEETLTLNYAALGRFQRQLKSLAKVTAAKKPKRTSVHGASTPPRAAGESSVPPTTATVSRIEQHLPEKWVAVVEKAPAFPSEDHVVLYKGKGVEQEPEDTGNWYPGRVFIRPDGSINLAFLDTRQGGDFNSRRMAQYWTPEYETAERHRLYAENRLPYTETWLIQIAIPKKFLVTCPTNQLWYSADWKEYVWWCRLCDPVPAKFDYLDSQTELVKGHILNRLSYWVTRIHPPDVQTEIDESHVMILPNGKKAIQWMFLLDNAKLTRLAEEIRGKVHIEVSVPTSRQGE